MSTLVNQIQTLAHQYVRSGSKENRRLQVGRMIKFVEFIEQSEQLHNLHEVGKRHVIQFWKAHRDMAPKTANAYWLALCVIWQWSNKPGTPPKPIIFAQTNFQKPASIQTELSLDKSEQISILPSLVELSRALEAYRKDRALSIEAVSSAAGLNPTTLSVIETGNEQTRYIDIATLINYYADTINLQGSIHE
ncbi:helix-turn-helix transcriptional regulator [Methylomonas sp. AM2-LC]|uniref:helix-turn-helix domain-containing protein n=1 Tax=Methylomonas sp. AM2-LC TaxID=3153301 RepID=UPI00326685FE